MIILQRSECQSACLVPTEMTFYIAKSSFTLRCVLGDTFDALLISELAHTSPGCSSCTAFVPDYVHRR